MNTVTFLKSTISHLGGLEKYTLRLARAFRDNGHQVRLITTGASDHIADLDDIHIDSFTFSHKISALKVLQFDAFCTKILKENPSPIIFGLDRNKKQTHLRAGNGVHRAYLERRKKTEGFCKSLSLSVNPLHKILLQIEKKSFEDPSLQTLFTNSFMVKKEILSHYKVDEKKIVVVHNGVEWEQMRAPFEKGFSEKEIISKGLGLDPSSFQFLFLGHNFRRKGLYEVLIALSRLTEKNVHLSVVGNDRELGFFKKKTAELNLEKKVTFWGQRKDVLSFYQVADCLILPSHYDPFANVTVEALAMGLYVITSSSNGASEIIKDFAGDVIQNVSSQDQMICSLEKALSQKKTPILAEKIRSSIAHLDFPSQLGKIYSATCLP